jgi:hypothetical protein
MRQMEGKRTVKRLSIVRPVLVAIVPPVIPRPIHERAFSETIAGLAAGTLAWLARIRSSLLLKTASFKLPAKKTRRRH